ncbi:MAG: hypothetical protein Q7V36_07405, partial [Deltaproteobacteria bacterium]|nr:hypothetical protein [Deltaproteobacteria bacterium]
MVESATNYQFSVLSAQLSDAGQYRCVVSNAYGAVTSAVVRVWLVDESTGQLGQSWQLVTNNAALGPNSVITAVEFDGKLFSLGGRDPSRNDVWASPDGLAWTKLAAPPWGARSEHAAAVFNGRLWVAGGDGNSACTPLSDVWSSADGTNWAQATAAPGWSGR